MIIEEALRKVLITGATVAGERIYPITLPAKVTLPAIAYTKVSTLRVHSLTGSSHLARPRFQFTAWAETYAVAKALANEIRTVLDAYSGTVDGVIIQASFVENELDMYDPESKLYGIPVDFFVTHTE